MAKKGGGLSRMLEFIGLVDDEEPEEDYGEDYRSGDYGRQPAYAPRPRQTRPQAQRQPSVRNSRAPAPPRPPQASRGEPPRSRSGQPQQYPPRNSSPRRSSYPPEERPARYDYTPRSSRFGSLDDAPADSMRPAPSRAPRRARTVMFTLHSLEDCCDVIDNLIAGSTVVLTMDELDVRQMQRAVDTLSGAVFALHATIRKASEHTYLIAPNGVEVNESYEMSSRYY